MVEVPTCGEELRLLLISLMLTNLLGPLLELKRPLRSLLTKVKAKGKRLFAMSKGKAVQPEPPPKAPRRGDSDEARAHRAIKGTAAEVGGRPAGNLAADADTRCGAAS